jgi:tetratricopeptide (TPR) repeat protein
MALIVAGLEQLIHLMKEAVDAYPDHPYGILIQSKLHEKAETYLQYWEKASQSFHDQNFNDAARHLKEVLRNNPTDVTAKELLEELGERSAKAQRFYKNIETGLEKGEDLNALVKMAREAVDIHPDFPEGRLVQIKLAQRSRQFRQAMEKGGAALRMGSWEMASKWFSQAQKLCPESVALDQMIENLSQITEVRRKIDDAVLHKRFSEAQHLARFVDLRVDGLKKVLPGLRD